MKVRTKLDKKKRDVIEITITSHDDIRALWALANTPTGDVRECSEENLENGSDVSDHYTLFNAIDDIAIDEGLRLDKPARGY